MPAAEDQPLEPISPYGESKLFVERVLRRYGEVYGLRWMALRYFNAAGADPEGEIGSDLEPELRLVPIVIQAALGLRPVVEIFGTDYPTPDGTAVRDYVHVSDIAEAHVAALRYLADGGTSMTLNLGTGRGYSVREIIDSVQRFSGRTVPVHEAQRHQGEAPAAVADASHARQVLGWEPHHSALDEIVRTAWAWQSPGGEVAPP